MEVLYYSMDGQSAAKTLKETKGKVQRLSRKGVGEIPEKQDTNLIPLRNLIKRVVREWQKEESGWKKKLKIL